MVRRKKVSAIAAMRRVVAVGILAALAMFAPKPARAGRPGADVIALFPK